MSNKHLLTLSTLRDVIQVSLEHMASRSFLEKIVECKTLEEFFEHPDILTWTLWISNYVAETSPKIREAFEDYLGDSRQLRLAMLDDIFQYYWDNPNWIAIRKTLSLMDPHFDGRIKPTDYLLTANGDLRIDASHLPEDFVKSVKACYALFDKERREAQVKLARALADYMGLALPENWPPETVK